ncbi:hypothetical protein H9P43_006120 [Blastocladiella emersonii ATCC 22665]|nr:hypothetical protein H9P43_006120 [Blastocladiella emersonii ATCC 22665]
MHRLYLSALALLAALAGLAAACRPTVRVLITPLPTTTNITDEESVLGPLAASWSAASGIDLALTWNPGLTTTDILSNLQNALLNNATDVVVFDGIWAGALSPSLYNLSQGLSGSTLAGHLPQVLGAGMINGAQVGLPVSLDLGVLYYQTSLLAKYGFADAPKTWDDIERALNATLPSERVKNPALIGYMSQLRSAEGLTAAALEWLASYRAGSVLEPNRTLSSTAKSPLYPAALATARRARRWIKSGVIGAPAIVSDDLASLDEWQRGNAVYLRHWSWLPRAAGNVSFAWARAPIPGNVAADAGVSMVGGMMVGVSSATTPAGTDRAATLLAAAWLASRQVQAARAVAHGVLPSLTGLWDDAAVCAAVGGCDIFKAVKPVARPSAVAGTQWLDVSQAIYTNWANMLRGQVTEEEMLATINSVIAQVMAIDLLGLPTNVQATDAVGLVMLVLAALGQLTIVLFALYALASHLRTKSDPTRWRRTLSSCPSLAAQMLAGAFLAYFVPAVYVGVPTPFQCIVQPWVTGLAASTVFNAMGMNLFHVYMLHRNPLARRLAINAVPARMRMMFRAASIGTTAAVLAVWTAVDPRVPADVPQTLSRYTACASRSPAFETAMLAILFVFGGAQLAFLLYLAVKTRKASAAQFPEAKGLGFCTYNLALIALVAPPLVYLNTLGQPLQYAILAMGTMLATGTLVATLLAPLVAAGVRTVRGLPEPGKRSGSRAGGGSEARTGGSFGGEDSQTRGASTKGAGGKASMTQSSESTGSTPAKVPPPLAYVKEGVLSYRHSRTARLMWRAAWKAARFLVYPQQGLVVLEPLDSADVSDTGNVLCIDELAKITPPSPPSPSSAAGADTDAPVDLATVAFTIALTDGHQYELMAATPADAGMWADALAYALANRGQSFAGLYGGHAGGGGGSPAPTRVGAVVGTSVLATATTSGATAEHAQTEH